jgi:hypothetical protein
MNIDYLLTVTCYFIHLTLGTQQNVVRSRQKQLIVSVY